VRLILDARDELREMGRPVAKAATAAIREAGVDLKEETRRRVIAAGFKKRFANTFRADVNPGPRRYSMSAAAMFYSKLGLTRDSEGYAHVFEDGSRIDARGKYLAIPSGLRGVPRRINRRRSTPELYEQEFGPLTYVPRGDGAMLVAKVRVRRRGQRITKRLLQAGTGGDVGVIQSVPIFNLVKSVKMPKRYQIREVAERAQRRLPALWARALEREDRDG